MTAFSDQPAPPKYGDPAGKNLVLRIEAAYRHARSLIVTTVGDGGNAALRIFPGGAQYHDSRASWRVADGELTIVPAAGEKAYHGAAKRGEVPFFLEQAGVEIDPFFRQLLLSRSPLNPFLGGATKVQFSGSLGHGADERELLEIDGPGERTSLEVSARTHFIVRMTTTVIDRNGHDVSTSQRAVSYPTRASDVEGAISTGGRKIVPLKRG